MSQNCPLAPLSPPLLEASVSGRQVAEVAGHNMEVEESEPLGTRSTWASSSTYVYSSYGSQPRAGEEDELTFAFGALFRFVQRPTDLFTCAALCWRKRPPASLTKRLFNFFLAQTPLTFRIRGTTRAGQTAGARTQWAAPLRVLSTRARVRRPLRCSDPK